MPIVSARRQRQAMGKKKSPKVLLEAHAVDARRAESNKDKLGKLKNIDADEIAALLAERLAQSQAAGRSAYQSHTSTHFEPAYNQRMEQHVRVAQDFHGPAVAAYHPLEQRMQDAQAFLAPEAGAYHPPAAVPPVSDYVHDQDACRQYGKSAGRKYGCPVCCQTFSKWQKCRQHVCSVYGNGLAMPPMHYSAPMMDGHGYISAIPMQVAAVPQASANSMPSPMPSPEANPLHDSQPPLVSAAALSSMTASQQREQLGEHLYPRVEEELSRGANGSATAVKYAPKVTGMLLESRDTGAVLALLEQRELLAPAVAEAMRIVEAC